MRLFFPTVITLSLALSLLSGCKYFEDGSNNQMSYKECLLNSFSGSHHYSAEETRMLCEEITSTADPSYRFEGGEMVPSNEFTSCYENKFKSLKAEGTENAEKIAQLLCKYGPD